MSFETGLKIAAIVIPLLFSGILVLMKIASGERKAILDKLDGQLDIIMSNSRAIAIHSEWIRQHDIWWNEYKDRIDERLVRLEHDRRRTPRP